MFNFVSTMPRDWLGRTSPKWPILCRVGRKTAINQYSITPTRAQQLLRWATVPERIGRKVGRGVLCPFRGRERN